MFIDMTEVAISNEFARPFTNEQDELFEDIDNTFLSQVSKTIAIAHTCFSADKVKTIVNTPYGLIITVNKNQYFLVTG